MTPEARTFPSVTNKHSFAKGFSLVELMVGVAISLIMFLVIGDVFINFESQKRVTTLSSDTQSSGGMAIFEMEQAIRSAGAGVASTNAFYCVPTNTYSYFRQVGPPAVETSPVPAYGQFFAPVVITNGAAGASDTIELRVGVPVTNGAPARLTESFNKAGPEQIVVERGTGFPLGSVLMVVGPIPEDPLPTDATARAAALDAVRCAVVEVTGFPNAPDNKTMSVAPSAGDTWNPTVGFRNTNAWPDFKSLESYVYAPGTGTAGIVFRTYIVNADGQLEVKTEQAGVGGSSTPREILVADVVKLHAQYGVSSAAGVQDIERWVEPVFGGTDETNWDPGSLNTDKIKRIKAIRLAIVMRSPKLEAGNVTSTCTTLGASVVNNGPCAWDDTAGSPAPQIDLSADANWQRYRYRVFQTIVPLRNIISAGV